MKINTNGGSDWKNKTEKTTTTNHWKIGVKYNSIGVHWRIAWYQRFYAGFWLHVHTNKTEPSHFSFNHIDIASLPSNASTATKYEYKNREYESQTSVWCNRMILFLYIRNALRWLKGSHGIGGGFSIRLHISPNERLLIDCMSLQLSPFFFFFFLSSASVTFSVALLKTISLRTNEIKSLETFAVFVFFFLCHNCIVNCMID